jgi:cytidylate kinase
MKLIMESWRRYLDEDSLDEGVYDPGIFKAIFLAGGPGSGKSYVASKTAGGHGFKVLNSDKAFEYLMKQAGMSLDMTKMSPEEEAAKDVIRDRAKEMTAVQKKAWCQGKLGQVIDGTGRRYDKILKLRKQYEEMGYDTYMIFVNTSLESTIEWNKKRERKVKEDILIPAWQDVQNNLGKFQSLFGNKDFVIVDNTPDLERGTEGATPQDLDAIWNIITKDFAVRPIRNPKAKAWIETEKGVCSIERAPERVVDQYGSPSERPPIPDWRQTEMEKERKGK